MNLRNIRQPSFRKTQGFSLLEMIFILIVVIVVVAALTLFYEQDEEGARVSQAVAQLLAVHEAADDYLKNMGATSTSNTWQQGLNMTNLQNIGLLTSTYTTSPWGGSVTLAASSQSGATYNISMQAIPNQGVCQKIMAGLQQSGAAFIPTSGCSSGNSAILLNLIFNIPAA